MPDVANAQKERAKVVIADTSWLVREGVARVLLELDCTCTIHAAPDGIVLHNVLRTHPDLSLVLVGRPLVGDEEEPLFRHIHKLAPNAVIGVVGEAFENESVRKAIYYGALGIVAIDETRETVVAALATLLDGQVALPAARPTVARGGPTIVEPVDDVAGLTPREHDVFALLGEGLSVSILADKLRLSPHTVRVHIARIMKKLDLRDRSALMHRAVSYTASQLSRQRSGQGPRP